MEHPDGMGDVLETLGPPIDQSDLDLALDLLLGGLGDGDAARRGNALEPRRH
jgi:hypothetical protein